MALTWLSTFSMSTAGRRTTPQRSDMEIGISSLETTMPSPEKTGDQQAPGEQSQAKQETPTPATAGAPPAAPKPAENQPKPAGPPKPDPTPATQPDVTKSISAAGLTLAAPATPVAPVAPVKPASDTIGLTPPSPEETCPMNTKGAPVNGNCECLEGFQCFDTHVKDGIKEDLKEFPNTVSKQEIKKNLENQPDATGCASKTRFEEPGVSLFIFSTKCTHCQCRNETGVEKLKAQSGFGTQIAPSLLVAAVLLSLALHV